MFIDALFVKNLRSAGLLYSRSGCWGLRPQTPAFLGAKPPNPQVESISDHLLSRLEVDTYFYFESRAVKP